MRNHRQPRYAVLLAALSFSILTLGLSLGWSVPTAAAAGPANSQASELVRLINGERAYHGEAALRVDSYLASKARDGAVACPNDASLVMAGRAKDFAVYGYPSNSHLLRLCPSYTSMDAMKAWGYKGSRGEITALNGGYGTGQVAYAFGCTPSLRTCPGSATSSYATSARAMTNWTSSSGHYSIIVGGYDRVGCGAWIGSNGAYYYDCMFSRGGRSVPKTAPRSGGAANPPAATQPAVTAVPSPTDPLGMPGGEAPPITRPLSSPTAGPTLVVEGVQATPSPDLAAALVGASQGGPQSDPPGGSAGVPATSRNLSVAAGAITAIFSLFYGLLLTVKRRRPRRRTAS